MSGPTLAALVRNRTMSRGIAATLRDAAATRSSFLVFAKPRLAGKTTVLNAILAHGPPGTAVRRLGADGDDPRALAREVRGGYLVVPEIARQAAMPGYIWGEPVRSAFAARECSLALTLHADSADEALAIVRENDVPEADVERLTLLVHLRSLGDDWQAPTRRVVAHVHRGAGWTLLHRWDEASDRFDDLPVAPEPGPSRAQR